MSVTLVQVRPIGHPRSSAFTAPKLALEASSGPLWGVDGERWGHTHEVCNCRVTADAGSDG